MGASRQALVGGLIALALALVSNASAATKRSTAVPSTTTAVPPPPTAVPSPPAVVTVRPIALGRPIPAGFVGLSLEYRTLLTYSGTDPAAINPVFVHLLRNLAPGRAPVLRIGGDSTDWTWWPVPKMLQPPGITYDITSDWLAVARALAHVADAHYILGINLEADKRAIETAEANALVAGIGRRYVTALELGNEPELYSKLGWYRLGSSYIPGRPSNYDFDGFTKEFSRFLGAVSTVPIAGPSTGSYWWLTHLAQFLAAEPSLGMVTVHSYWLNKCLSSTNLPGYPTVRNLLNPHPPSRLARGLAKFAALAHGRGVPIRIDEMNSVTCGGQHGVSDVFASSLWALNALFEAMSDGVDGVNLHTFPGTANQLFGFTMAGGHWAATVRPEYYGLLMFARAAPPGSKLLKIIQQHTGQTRAWATMGRDGYTRVVLINDSLTQLSSVLVRTSTPRQPATLERLLAPSPYATSGVTLNGQGFGTQTLTGTLSGPSATLTMPAPRGPEPIAGYVVPLPAASAAMLTIAPRPPAPARH
ncbi:MAG: glycosyl hydrolase family 79 C-terminal domain-containing protein [Actinomycetota bacterium]|nr:glycosyl hydrolase family 79 C-terminal domain-containing protein [Actinomycetota bacterium]